MDRNAKGQFIRGHKFNLCRKLPNMKPKPKKGHYINCKICSASFYVTQKSKRKYCSHKCYWKSKIGVPGWLLGKHHTKESNNKNRLSHLGRFIGEDAPNWKGGIYPKEMLIRRSNQYKLWQRQVFERDNFTCRVCNIHGSYLEAHHVIRFYECYRYDKGLIFYLDNGITLCRKCHKEIHRPEKEFNDINSWAQKNTIAMMSPSTKKHR